jgi:hypothetical protein
VARKGQRAAPAVAWRRVVRVPREPARRPTHHWPAAAHRASPVRHRPTPLPRAAKYYAPFAGRASALSQRTLLPGVSAAVARAGIRRVRALGVRYRLKADGTTLRRVRRAPVELRDYRAVIAGLARFSVAAAQQAGGEGGVELAG